MTTPHMADFRVYLWAWCLSLIFVIINPAWASDNADKTPIVAGKIDLIVGNMQILPIAQAAHAAHVGDTIYEGDTLLTGKDSEAHITMSDSGFLALRANTQLQITSYKADGGDDDKGIFNLTVGALRSISGWIGKFNRSSYLLHTPTATIGIRGTDHETRYIPAGSADGEPGTYDKVFFGETSIQSNTGQTAVTVDKAGYAASDGEQQPQVLPKIPGFFRPGPHEDLINQKHAEIQKMILQRREERRKIVEQKLAELKAARQDMQEQVSSNKAAAAERMAAQQEQRQSSDEQLAQLRARSEALQQRVASVQEMRKGLQSRLIRALRTNPDLREQFKATWEKGKQIGKEYGEIREARKALADNNLAATEARKTATEAQRTQHEAQLAALAAETKTLQDRQQTIQTQREALQNIKVGMPGAPGKAELQQQRKAIEDATDALSADQKNNQAAYNAVFNNNLTATQTRMQEAQAQRNQTETQNAEFNTHEANLQAQQRINEDTLEALQAQAIDRLGGDNQLRDKLQAIHDEVEKIRTERSDIQNTRKALHDKNLAETAQRQAEAMQQLEMLRSKHNDVAARNSDLQNERESMRNEIRSLFEQEQNRYREELRIDRAQGAITSAMSNTSTDSTPEN